jgi:nitric oxide reductase NorE protein
MKTEKLRYPPGDFAVWIVIYIELATFGLFFAGFAYVRAQNVEMFNASQQLLDTRFGLINTLLLITSSYFVVKAVNYVKQTNYKQQIKKAANYLLFATILGGAFIVLKLFEFSDKFTQGIHLSTDKFFMFYFMLTMFHFAHVLLGIIILFHLFYNTKNGHYSPQNHKGLESGASYWHMVDLVWIVLFALVYILR